MNVSLQADSGIRTRLFKDSSQPLMTTLPLLWPSPASRSLNQQIIFHWMWVLLLNKSVRPLSVLIFSLVNQPNFLALIWNDLSRSPPPLSLFSLRDSLFDAATGSVSPDIFQKRIQIKYFFLSKTEFRQKRTKSTKFGKRLVVPSEKFSGSGGQLEDGR